jgi:hypothetical protein
MTTSEKRNWHAIEGPNGRCACGQQPDGTFKDCAQLLAEEVGRENRTLREALEKDLAEWEAVQADNPLDILQHCITRVRAALAASAPASTVRPLIWDPEHYPEDADVTARPMPASTPEEG